MIVKTVFQLMASAVVFFFLMVVIAHLAWNGESRKMPKWFVKTMGVSIFSLMITIPLFFLSIIWSI